jgi:hypothetical protein
MWTERIRVGSKVWIQDTWGRRAPVEVMVTRIWRGDSPRVRHFHFEPQAFGNSFFGWNGTCQSTYHHAYKTKQEAEGN